jgi:hypothetical protein
MAKDNDKKKMNDYAMVLFAQTETIRMSSTIHKKPWCI